MRDRQVPPPLLSVAIIARNAAAELRETIASVEDLAQEIVVLDTGSTDDTPQVAQASGVVTSRRPWDDDFSAARNACLDAAHGQWILWLDAGEQLAPHSATALRRALAQPVDPKRAYLLPILLPNIVGHVDREQVFQPRLHPLAAEVRFVGRVREWHGIPPATIDLSFECLDDVSILRSASDHDPNVRAAKAQRNIRLADLAIAESGPSAAMHNCLGEALQILGDPLRAAHQYRRALDLPKNNTRDQLESYYGLLTCLDSAQPDRHAQLSLAMQALERFPLDAQLLVALGGYLQAIGHVALAIRAYDVAFHYGQTELRLWHLPAIREIAAACAAAAYELLGQSDQAQTLLLAAIRLFPNSARLELQLAGLNTQSAGPAAKKPFSQPVSLQPANHP
jgi:tetratricopeptide (TPR) repeat protein